MLTAPLQKCATCNGSVFVDQDPQWKGTWPLPRQVCVNCGREPHVAAAGLRLISPENQRQPKPPPLADPRQILANATHPVAAD